MAALAAAAPSLGLPAQQTPPVAPAAPAPPPAGASQAEAPATPAGGAAADLLLELPPLRELYTPDGSRVVLVPTSGAPVVHWVVATPAGVLEEPPGLEGLSFAVARASLAGTSMASSLDPQRELEALAALDKLEQALDQARAKDLPLPPAALAAIEQARAAAAALCDPLAWQRAVRSVPALGPELLEVAEGSLLRITTSPLGIAAVAQLLRERREGNVLRGIHEVFRAVRAELTSRRADGTQGAMRREVLGLCFLGHPYSRAYALPERAAPLTLAQALLVWQQTQQPARTCHVLVGGFDPDLAAEQLRAAFAQTRLPPAPRPPALPLSASTAERRAVLSGGQLEGLAIGYRLPPGLPLAAVRVFAEWLAGDREAQLPAALRRSGRPAAQATAIAPFPGRSSGLLLIEVEDHNPRPVGGRTLDEFVDPILQRLAETDPAPDAVQRAAAAVAARTTAAQLGDENLALHLALACGLDGQRADAALSTPPAVTPAMVADVARRVLVRKNRALVRREVAR